MDSSVLERISRRTRALYGPEGEACSRSLVEVMERFAARLPRKPPRQWDQTDVMLITYGDMVRSDEASPLTSLERFFSDEQWNRLLSTVHILPFFPYSSDDGFSVIDYWQVDPALGNWNDIDSFAREFRLGFDLVLNHVSSQSKWFRAYRRGEEPFTRYFIEADPSADLSSVTRPRSLPLLTEFQTSRGPRHIWTTFSADQVDLNFADPAVLVAMIDILLNFVAHGAQVIRLDAIAYLWKEVGTSCIHLPQTHEIVKLMRDVLTAVAPHVWLLSETNVPHRENVSYFGDGDEAQLVYQFSLPPLLLDAFIQGDATYLMQWLDDFEETPPGTSFLNFTASHDGIGVRPLEGLVPDGHLQTLLEATKQRGGFVSSRRREDGVDVPYELNITYLDALRPDAPNDAELHARRFLASQAVMLAMKGIPGVYFHSLVGSQNDREAAEKTGHPRRINRHKFERSALERHISAQGTLAHRIYTGYRMLLELRRRQPAFHPEGNQQVIKLATPQVISFERYSPDGQQTILILVNVGTEAIRVDLSHHLKQTAYHDLISDETLADASQVELIPGQAQWMVSSPG